ncbi:lipoprotein [Catellatospora methionotrophica]|uniref:Lipoprotein n=2 Tax=Catellatospora methionotrophica TaxID=121620 RepID=A0A8J3PCH5_9ACTN|nr:lipoprotein [Catellatospora methionotrophica]
MLVAVLTAGVAALALTACGSGSATPAASAGASTPSAMASSVAAAPVGEFGAGCAAVPTDPADAGSFQAMAKVPVATAASGNPLLSTLVTAVKKANLVDTLNSAPAITVFAPTNDAFAKIPKADLDKVLADNATLTKILTYHVVAGKLTPEQLAGTHKTLQGGEITVAGSGEAFTVNGSAKVVCGNVQTANATVYIIDSVLMPQ